MNDDNTDHNDSDSNDRNLTQRLSKDTNRIQLGRGAFGLQLDAVMSGYLRLPLSVEDGEIDGPMWRIMLEVTGGRQGLLPFEIADDVVFGRGSDGDDAPDLDLTALKAYEMGVSRRHAILRPTAKHLYLIDLDSTNGTFHNGVPIRGKAQQLAQGDHISFGKLNMSVVTLEYVPGRKAGRDTSELSDPNPAAAKPSNLPETNRLQGKGE